MPVPSYILENKVLGREFRRGWKEGYEEARQQAFREGGIVILRRAIAKRFGDVPPSLERRLGTLSFSQLEEIADRILEVSRPDELLS